MAGLKSGSTLKGGKYKIIRTLGQGSFGITYLASTRTVINGELGRMEVSVNVTVKEFFMSDLNSRSADGSSVEKTGSSLVKNYLSKFRREAENLSRLNHPNIVKVLEVFEENNTAYYVMEFIDGETLDDYIRSKGHLPEDEALRIAGSVCSALSYMHGHKMLHLDLKPKNIMLDSEGGIRLIDFGLAKQYNDKGEPESSTSLGLGTPGYAPVEQAQYKQDGTLPATLDIYALGATLYKMLTGKTPPESSYILNEGLPQEVLHQAGVSPGVVAVVTKAMAPLRKDRYPSVDALQGAVAAMLSSAGGVGTGEDTSYDTEREKKASDSGFRKPVAEAGSHTPDAKPSSLKRYSTLLVFCIAVAAFGILLFNLLSGGGTEAPDIADDVWMEDSIVADEDAVVEDTAAVEEEAMPSVPALPRTAEITLKVDSDADIYIDNERKGRRTWKGTLLAGSYRVECRQANCRTTTETLVVEAGRSRTVTLTAPTPLTGKLSVKSDPSGATVLIDGKERGTTPLLVPDLATGSHALTLRRDGYVETKQTVTVKEDATTETKLTLKAKPAETPTAGNSVATQSNSSSSSNNGTFTVNGVTFKMVRVEGGSTGTFYIGETEVTQALWQAVMGNNPSRFKGANRPVEKVSWDDCKDFIGKLNKLTGKTFRLPKESEWEYAAKGGNKSRGYIWSGCNSEEELAQYAWYDKNAYYCGSDKGNSSHPDYGTHNVKTRRPNELGLYDMSGNVWEWCEDLYSASGSIRVGRGGSWDDFAWDCRVADRNRYAPANRYNFLGLRLAL